MWSPTPDHGSCVREVEEGECAKLRNQGVFHWEENGGPRDSRGDDPIGITGIAMDTAIFSPL